MRHKLKWFGLLVAVLVIAMAVYIHVRPLVFNESFWEHAHCIKIAGVALHDYAAKNGGKFPYHSEGYGSALLLLDKGYYFALTGPGYDASALNEAKKNANNVSEKACGRVYIQGLTTKSNPSIVILFDRIPTPGGDHCHLFHRLTAPIGREVLHVDGSMEFVKEMDWPAFCRDQINLVVKEGIERDEAERLFSQ